MDSSNKYITVISRVCKVYLFNDVETYRSVIIYKLIVIVLLFFILQNKKISKYSYKITIKSKYI